MRKAAPIVVAAVLLLAGCGAPAPTSPAGSGKGAAAKTPVVHASVKTLPSLPSARAGLAAVMVNGTVYTIGGLTFSDASSSTVWAYQPPKGVTGTWYLPFRTHDVAAAVSGSTVLVLGGGRYTSLDTFGSFSVPPGPAGTTLAFRTLGTTPEPYSDLWAGMFDGLPTIVGGYNDKAASNQVWQYRNGVWHVLATLPVGVRYAAVAVSPTALYVVGGMYGTNSGPDTATDGVYLVRTTGQVTKLATLPQSLYRAGAAWIDGNLFVFGGYTGQTYLDQILELNLKTRTWSTVGHLPAPWAYGAYVAAGTQVWLIGGQNASGTLATVTDITLAAK